MDREPFKKQAGERAVDDHVRSGMKLGLGTGSTAIWALRRIAEKLESGELTDIVGVPTSSRTRAEAEKLGVPLTTLTDHPQLDLTIDGADEIDPALNLIKGGGGALLWEKIVAQASAQVFIVGDVAKRVDQLGTTFKLPVEVIPFGVTPIAAYIKEIIGATPTLRTTDDNSPYTTDSGHQILDCHFPDGIADVAALATQLASRAGIVEHGLFVQLATEVIVAGEQGITVFHPKIGN
jgi:ribose 5-phosphate isomerase A